LITFSSFCYDLQLYYKCIISAATAYVVIFSAMSVFGVENWHRFLKSICGTDFLFTLKIGVKYQLVFYPVCLQPKRWFRSGIHSLRMRNDERRSTDIIYVIWCI